MEKFEINPSWLRYPVNSSQIKEVAFDKKNNKLYVTFKTNGSTYSYDYTLEAFEEFLNADSIGKYFAKNIKPLTCKKVNNGS